ncbi:alpha/beta fold hydrolase [Nocardia terpenica]|uniref:alpha/beta fold hydrolase n=1 Tax=Nocardia terpenica TaxID=455432 RepID=UPI001895DB18|nr:alpha/beta fold hydrolase [Nocardia terpenica]MBF6066073.1 alpha/beta fold hydrolase [Nocardia terpenica]MBF6109236.1 alpha/beta fold hydrolase [Nocardia terpenica]MBF6116317.1 alpha/beta fold hydrolase [Nocardia terpenica]MBF6123474.1 alpha/beta fold hydrolase [Nocardia terpenica]MBF6156751.1 alpha/beta fold hydrolase [Nocardia terpenica]
MSVPNRIRLLAATFVLTLLATPIARADDARMHPGLQWRACGDGLHCATMEVPLDYSDPDGGTIRIAVIRRSATDSAHRAGSLVVDPGGPGVSGVEFVRDNADYFSPAVRAHYDLIGFDPRGVAASTRVHCGDGPYDPPEPLPVPPTADALAAIAHSHTTYGLRCREVGGPLAEHVDTASTARDLDRLRAALGLSTLDYYGISYGTLLGITYARLFPGRIGRMILDSVEDHSLPYQDTVVEQALSRQAAFDHLAHWADDRHRAPAGDFTDRYRRLVAVADRHPIPAPHVSDHTPVTGVDIELAVYAALARPEGWAGIVAAVDQADHGDASSIHDALFGLTDADTLASVRTIACSDFPGPSLDAIGFAAVSAGLRAIAPTQVRGVLTDQLRCYGWPLPVADPPDATHAHTANPVLILGTTTDPITPYPAAVRAQQLVSGSILLTRNGVGHGVYGRDPGITAAADQYLLAARPSTTPGIPDR